MVVRNSQWIVALLAAVSLAGCGQKAPQGSTSAPDETEKTQLGVVSVLFTYGSEKEDWVEAVTAEFNRRNVKTAAGNSVAVKAVPMGSEDCIDKIIDGSTKAQITSPASTVFIKLGNAKWRAKTGKDLIPSTDNLLHSPVVIAMWQPMAEALGWGKKPVGWADILSLAANEKGWAAYGLPQWGQFRFGHTHPQFSNSGLISLLAEVYAASGKTANLSSADIEKPETAQFLSAIEKSVVHYGDSTGLFSRRMFSYGPKYLSAAVMYESMVIDSHQQKKYPLEFPIVAIYPKEGTLSSDHPAGIVEREWVSTEQREAAGLYLAFLKEKPQQEKAMELGFRPALAEVPLTSPIDTAHGVNPQEPQTTLEVPAAESIDAITKLWRENKKRSNVILVMDCSDKMNENERIQYARPGGQELIRMLSDADSFRVLPYTETLTNPPPAGVLRNTRKDVMKQVGTLIPKGGAALYDAIASAYRDLPIAAGEISAIVVLAAGPDTNSSLKLDQLLDLIRSENQRKNIRIFTIGYDAGADKTALQKIAESTQARFYESDPKSISETFKDIATFF